LQLKAISTVGMPLIAKQWGAISEVKLILDALTQPTSEFQRQLFVKQYSSQMRNRQLNLLLEYVSAQP